MPQAPKARSRPTTKKILAPELLSERPYRLALFHAAPFAAAPRARQTARPGLPFSFRPVTWLEATWERYLINRLTNCDLWLQPYCLHGLHSLRSFPRRHQGREAQMALM